MSDDAHPNDTAYLQMLQDQHDANREDLPQREPGATLPPLPRSTLPCYHNHRTDQGPHLREDCAEYPLIRQELCNDPHGSDQPGFNRLGIHYSDDCEVYTRDISLMRISYAGAPRSPFVDPMTVKPGTVFRPAEPAAPPGVEHQWSALVSEAQREADERADELWTLLAFAAERRMLNAARDVLRLLSS